MVATETKERGVEEEQGRSSRGPRKDALPRVGGAGKGCSDLTEELPVPSYLVVISPPTAAGAAAGAAPTIPKPCPNQSPP